MKNLIHKILKCLYTLKKTSTVLCVLLYACIHANGQVHADFSVSPQSGCAPLLVNFQDLSTGSPIYWKWDLGNGTVSYLQNPSTTYFNPGVYSVKLVIKNDESFMDSIVKTQIITVYASPTVRFSANPLTGCFPLPVQFSDSSTANSGTIANKIWDFGDGNFSNDNMPLHTYNSSGNFNVSLRITNSYGCSSSATYPQYIKLNTGVHADFSNSEPATCNQPATINFINNSTGTGALSYLWKFGDGNTSAAANPTHTYHVGTYTVSLIVHNSTGCADTITKQNIITLDSVRANFTAPVNACQQSAVSFTNTSNPVPSQALWSFGDSTFSDSVNTFHVFQNPGSYNVKLVSGFGGCRDSVIKKIQIIAKPVVDFSAAQTTSCHIPFTVNFINASGQGSSYAWDFGDGSISNFQNPSHTYTKEGFYSVKFTVNNSYGCTNYTYKNNFIKIQKPVASINNLPQKGCAPLTNTFTATISSVDSVIQYHWDFGDNSSSQQVSPTHTFVNPGSYTIKLTYTTASGCTDTATVVNGILVGTKPTVNFSADPKDVCAQYNVNFTDHTSGNPNEWHWSFGDGATSIDQNPVHNYGDTGYFTVTLIALNNGCSDTLVIPKIVHIKPPIARFTFTNSCLQPGHIIFKDASIGADTWSWTFGDGSTSLIQNPVHDYAVSGNYGVALTVTNKITGCSYTHLDTINIYKEKADFTTSVNSVCKNTPVTFSAINSIPSNIASYTWRFGDGVNIAFNTNATSHAYAIAGSYNVTLILNIKNGCKDSITKPLAVKVNGPTAVFSAVVPGACQNSTVAFNDSSYDSNSSIKLWQWNWGDGTIQSFTAPPYKHTYTIPGNYTVSLKVTDGNGCTDSINHQNTIVISKPIALFTADTLSCTGGIVTFTNSSTGPSLQYAWNFGDGTTSAAVNPSHMYSKEGIYSVSLAITDLYGCTDFVSKNSYIKIANPKADFTVSDTTGTCPPLVVKFTNLSKNYSFFAWEFGDGSSSSTSSPSHFYSTPGVFIATLTVRGTSGCVDRKSVRITVKGPVGDFSYDKMSGCNPLLTNFTATTTKNISFIWDFNDGTTVATPDSIISHKYITADSYLPKLILVDSAGCKVPVTGKDSIKVYGVTANFKTNNSIFCDSAHVAFTNTSISNDVITNYLWYFGDGSSTAFQSPVHTYISAGIYTSRLIVTTRNGCIDSTTKPSLVKIVRSPSISIKGNDGACAPATLTFTGTINVADTSGLTWSWNFGNGNTFNKQNPPSQSFLNAGTYNVKAIATNSSGCTDTAYKDVQAYRGPALNITPDTALCKGSSITLQSHDASTYSWTPSKYLSCESCATPVSRPDSSIKYFVKGTTSNGCIATDSVFIAVKQPNTVKVNNPDTLCFGSSVQLSATGAEVYSWSPANSLNNSNIATPVATPAVTTFYTVTGTDTKKCFTSTAKVPVMVYPIPVVNAGADKTINVGQSFKITPQLSDDVTSFTWTPSTDIIARDSASIIVKPDQSIEYTIEVSNDGHCNALDRISIYVMCDNTNVFMPNTFSPNGDGVNDIFYPRGSGVFNVKNLHIFNRWGEVIFEKANFNANDASAGWDGTYKGKKLDPDVFVYTLEVLCANNQSLIFKGNVALIR